MVQHFVLLQDLGSKERAKRSFLDLDRDQGEEEWYWPKPPRWTYYRQDWRVPPDSGQLANSVAMYLGATKRGCEIKRSLSASNYRSSRMFQEDFEG